MFITISLPWPVPSANVALTGLASAGNRVRVADEKIDDREPVAVGYGTRHL